MKNTYKPTVSIGIPAFNEERNIRSLVTSLLQQRQSCINLDKIIVLSDGSTDRTVEVVRTFNPSKVQVIDGKTQKGQGYRQNEFFQRTHSDIAIILNADTVIRDHKFIEKISKAIINNQADLTSPLLKPLKPRTFFESVLYVSCTFKNQLFSTYRNGNSIYTCSGPARAFSKNLYKKIQFRHSVGEDAYSYLFCTALGYRYHYCSNTAIYYRLPDNLGDHQLQSLRYFSSQKLYTDEFEKDFVASQYQFPFINIAHMLILWLIKEPLRISCYLAVLIYMKVLSYLVRNSKKKWEVATTSKYVDITPYEA